MWHVTNYCSAIDLLPFGLLCSLPLADGWQRPSIRTQSHTHRRPLWWGCPKTLVCKAGLRQAEASSARTAPLASEFSWAQEEEAFAASWERGAASTGAGGCPSTRCPCSPTSSTRWGWYRRRCSARSKCTSGGCSGWLGRRCTCALCTSRTAAAGWWQRLRRQQAGTACWSTLAEAS